MEAILWHSYVTNRCRNGQYSYNEKRYLPTRHQFSDARNTSLQKQNESQSFLKINEVANEE
jgi:hypothetical protein